MAINFNTPYIHTMNLGGKQIDVLRLDAIHQFVSGNKWYKLQAYIKYIQEHKLKGFVTFGGAYSNHLHAAAYVAKAFGIQSVAVIRGQELEQNLGPTLLACQNLGMRLVFLSRSAYKSKAEIDYLADLNQTFPNYLIIPEGGSGELGEVGIASLHKFLDEQYDAVCVSIGSGTTFKGLLPALQSHQTLYGFVPMKNGAKMASDWRLSEKNYELFDEFHFGGFGKMTNELLIYMNNMFVQYQLPTDRVYTAKMFYGLEQLILRGKFADKNKILAIHTGGLQGNVSISDQLVY